MTNALNNTSVTAAKIWEDDSNTKGNRPKSVVFELKYTTDKDTVATRTWHSFITPARVILNGTADTGSNGKMAQVIRIITRRQREMTVPQISGSLNGINLPKK